MVKSRGKSGFSNQLRARAPLRIPVGRLRTTLLLHIGAYLRRRRARPRSRSRTPSRRQHGGWWQLVGLLDTFGLGDGRSRCSLLPSHSLRVVRVARAFYLATRDRVGPSTAGRPNRGGPQPVVSKSHPSGKNGVTGHRRSGGSLPRRGRRGAGADMRGRPEPAGLSITKGRMVGSNFGEPCRREYVPRILMTFV